MQTRIAAKAPGQSDLLAIGFGTAVAMWGLGYFCRLFGDAAPPALLFGLLLAAQLGGGFVLGRFTYRGLGGGVAAGLITGLVNLLIVGSVISGDTPNAIKQGALLWVPGTLAVSIVLTLLGAGIGALGRTAGQDQSGWTGWFGGVAAVATFNLLGAGGLVTGYDEGLAVVDWPNTEGYNMFLYPLARMTGGIYLEHAHRLLGSLVGLITLVFAIQTQITERRGWVKGLAWITLLFVIVQGILGGLRVTGRLTLSTNPSDTDPKILLAIVHGVFGQVVFGVLTALAVVRSRAWHTAGAPRPVVTASTDRTFTAALVVLLIVQLVIGALVRHFTWALDISRHGLAADPKRLEAIGQGALHLHITVAVIVLLLAIAVGIRAWGLYRSTVPALPRLGQTMLILVGVQIVLGIAALIVTSDDNPARRPGWGDVAITTAHQVVGAALLAWAVMLYIWNYRLLRQTDATLAPSKSSAPAAK